MVLVDKLLEQSYGQLAVLDITNKALAIIKQGLGSKANRIEWFSSDIAEFVAPHPFHSGTTALYFSVYHF